MGGHRRENSASTAMRFAELYVKRRGGTPIEVYRQEGQRQRVWSRGHKRNRQEDRDEKFREAPLREIKSEEWAVFRECVLRHVGYFPRSGFDIRSDVLADYGSHGERRFWRAIARLVAERAIMKTVEGYRICSSLRTGGGT